MDSQWQVVISIRTIPPLCLHILSTMSLPTHHLASKLQANWLAQEPAEQADQLTKLDDLTSLSWLHNVSILPVNNNRPASVKEGAETIPGQQKPAPPPASAPSASPCPKPASCPGPQSHPLQDLLSKKFQIQQKTSVKKLCHHFRLLSQVLPSLNLVQYFYWRQTWPFKNILVERAAQRAGICIWSLRDFLNEDQI